MDETLEWGTYQPKVVRKNMCETCPHKQMHEQFTFVHQYPDKPHPCHELTGYACKGAYLELKLRDCLNPSIDLDTENGV